jgi:hypothetical protein
MKVLVGTFRTDHGTVATSADGESGNTSLIYAGPDPEHVRTIVESERPWYDRAGIRHVLTDEELVRSLPYRLEGSILWAVFVDEATGLTLDRPPYDPWGDVWYSGKTAPTRLTCLTRSPAQLIAPLGRSSESGTSGLQHGRPR